MTAAMLSIGVYAPAYAEEYTGVTTGVGEEAEHESNLEVLEAAGFTELDDTVFTSEQIESKMNLASHMEELEDCEAGEDYVANEVVVEAEDEQTASEYADAFNARLVSFEYGKALLELNPEEADIEEYDKDLVALAVDLSADTGINLPAAWPNYIDEFFEDSYDYTEFDDFSYEYDDPQLSRLTGTGSETSLNDLFQWHHEIVDSNAAWRAGYKGRGVNVVVIDSGINEHEDITWDGAERIVLKADGSYEITYDAKAVTTHGTPVSGLIRGKAGNGLGGAGIAPECFLYMIRVDEDSGAIDTYTESIAVDRAVEVYDADVINLSIGGVNYTEYYEKSIKSAYEQGVAVVCAAGNNATGSVTYPACYKGSIAVAGTTRSNERYSLSNYGSMIRYAAPGAGVIVPFDGSYANKNGTSFSAPIISGVMAVVFGSGKITSIGRQRVDDALKLLDRSCTYIGEGCGKGIPSLALALGLDSNDSTPGIVRAGTAPGTYEQQELLLELTTENTGSVHEDIIFYSDDGNDVTFINGVASGNAKKYDPAAKITVTGKRSVTIKAIAVNPANGLASKQVTYNYILKPLVSDIAISTDTGSFKLQKGKNLTLISKCYPEYAGNTNVSYEVTGWPGMSSGQTRLYVKGSRLYATDAVPGKYTISCTANDKGHFSKSFDIYVESADKKVYSINASERSVEVYAGTTRTVEVALTTIENGVKQTDNAQDYSTWTSTAPAVATVSVTGNVLAIDAHKSGVATVKGVSNDGTGVSRSVSVKVMQHPESIAITPVAGGKVAAGKNVRLTAEVFPSDTTNKSVVWSIVGRPVTATDRTTAAISAKSGTFSAKNAVPGVYTVRATTVDSNNAGSDIYDDYDIEVYGGVKGIRLGKGSADIFRLKNAYGSSTKDSIEVILDGGSYESLSVINPDPGIVCAKLSQRDDKIWLDIEATANAAGSSRIKVVSNDGSGKSATCNVTVSNPPSCLEIYNPLLCTNLAKGRSVKLVPRFGTAYGKLSSRTQKLSWSSTDPESVSVDQNGTIKAKSDRGSAATITAKTADGKMSCSIRIVSVANTSRLSVYGPLYRMKRTADSTYFWEPCKTVLTGRTVYMAVDNASDPDGKVFAQISSANCDVSVNKPGLSAVWNSVGADRDINSRGETVYSKIRLTANKPGTYYVTIRMRNRSSVSKKIKVVVKD